MTFCLTGPSLTIRGGMLPLMMLRPTRPRSRGWGPGGDAAAYEVAAAPDQFARMGIGRKAQQHGHAAVARQPAGEHAPASAGGRVVVLDVVEQQRRPRAGALRQPRD